VEVKRLHGGNPWRATLGGELYEAAERALAGAWNADVVYAGEGGSIPIVPEFEQVLGAPVLLMGFGLPGENAHAPDEWMSVECFEKGAAASARLWTELGRERTR
jgi:acetylornithine deacetylase/succinyl-diaminopimelate desuccinylase-like protein